MKVLFIVSAYPRHAGDVITPWLLELIRRLRARGVDVEVLAPAYRGSGDQVREGVKVHRFRYAPGAWETLTHDQTAPDRISSRPWFLGLVPTYVVVGSAATVRLLRGGGFDVVHCFWPLPHGLLGWAGRAFAGVPLVCTFFGVELRWARRKFPFLLPLLRRMIRASDAVTAISSDTAAEVVRVMPGSEPRVIPFGAAVEAAEPAGPGPAPAPGASWRWLFVGRLVRRKGVDVLLHALSSPAGGVDELLVVGDGPERERLEALAGELELDERVEFRGFVPDAELAEALRSCDGLVLPAVVDEKGDTEGLGVVLIEALAAGVPVIASEVGGIPDIVEDGATGLLTPPGDAAALAGAMARYREDPALARRLADRGRRTVAERFSWDRITEDLIAVYRQVARPPAP